MSEKTGTSNKQILLQEHPESPMVCLTGIGNELFEAIQDPILVVTPDGIIIDANNAALNAAKKNQSEILGQGICKIIHGGSSPHLKCPLEEFLLTCSSRIEETWLATSPQNFFK